MIVSNLPEPACSQLDVGAGEGTRAEALAHAAGINEVVLLEPSAAMRSLMLSSREVWTSRIEDLELPDRRFDVITCLWNVLGHVTTAKKRLRALQNMKALLSPTGRLFLDVQNRHNARAYGAIPTFGRWLCDAIAPSSHNGDVTVHWRTSEGELLTYGHVFTPKEISDLFREAGIKIVKKDFVDYATGELCTSRFVGSMFFVLSH